MNLNSSAFPDDSAFLDVIPLHQSIGDEELAEFEAFLDDNYDALASSGLVASHLANSALPHSMASSRCSIALDDSDRASLFQSKNSSAMDFEFEELAKSMENVTFSMKSDPEPRPQQQHYQQEQALPAPSRKSGRRRSSKTERKSFKLNQVNFDPISSKNPSSFCDDESMQSFHTAEASSVHSSFNTVQTSNSRSLQQQRHLVSESSLQTLVDNHANTSHQSSSPVVTPEKYNAALEKLAQSMKRTEESRRQVLIQRELQLKASEEDMMSGADRSKKLAQFFSGSRSTLTSGLEQSRKQLSMYMGQVNNQTF